MRSEVTAEVAAPNWPVKCECPSGEFGFHRLKCQRRCGGDTSERYYAYMEAHRNEAEDEYFKARPQADGLMNRQLFRAGYERAYRKMWDAMVRGGVMP